MGREGGRGPLFVEHFQKLDLILRYGANRVVCVSFPSKFIRPPSKFIRPARGEEGKGGKTQSIGEAHRKGLTD